MCPQAWSLGPAHDTSISFCRGGPAEERRPDGAGREARPGNAGCNASTNIRPTPLAQGPNISSSHQSSISSQVPPNPKGTIPIAGSNAEQSLLSTSPQSERGSNVRLQAAVKEKACCEETEVPKLFNSGGSKTPIRISLGSRRVG